MVSINVSVANVEQISNGLRASISGKNGFTSLAGKVSLLVKTAPLEESVSAEDEKIVLTIDNLKDAIDTNFNKHILQVNDGLFNGLKGTDFITIPVKEKTGTGAEVGFVGYNPELVNYSANIRSFDLTNNTVRINNEEIDGIKLFNVLPSIPFYVDIFQILDKDNFSNNTIFLEGSRREIENITDVSKVSGTQTIDLKTVPRHKGFITVFKDGVKLDVSDFTFVQNTSTININIVSDDVQIRTVVDDYTVPAIEVGDNVFLEVNNVYSITDASYVVSAPSYNAHLTANCIYRAILNKSITKNISGESFINISPDINGTIGNVNVSAKTFTVDYDNTIIPGDWSLSNNKIYNIQVPLSFNPITLGRNSLITDVPSGLNIVRTRTVNPIGRKSPFVTKSIFVRNSRIRKVTDLEIREFLSIGTNTTQGVIVNAEISFTHIINQDIVSYEVSFKLGGEASDSINFNTVTVPAAGVSLDGKIRVKLTDLERGRTSGVNTITVRVTAISSTDLRGITAEKTSIILGKTALPKNVSKFVGGQSGTNLSMAWAFPLRTDGTVFDLDLLEIEIRKNRGIINSSEFNSKWLVARKFATIPVPNTSLLKPITDYGTNTYLIKTRDTSKNESANAIGLTLTTVRPIDSSAFKIFSEDDPTGNVVVGLPNDNRLDANSYVSFRDSNNGGFNKGHLSTEVENANGTSSGWSALSDTTDLFASDDAVYQTQIRDMGASIKGTILTTFDGSQASRFTFNDFRKDLLESVTSTSSTSNVLVDSSFGGIGTILTSNNAVYDDLFNTLKDDIPSGNVYAIWNSGQFTNDGSNANSFALIAGVINTNAIALGETYHANGVLTGSNNFSNLNSNSITYQLVDLQQFSDPKGTITFEGKDAVTALNIKVRTSEINPFYANGNVNVAVFVNTSTDDQGFKDWTPAQDTFRYFQLRYELENSDPNAADFTVDIITYTVELESKIFTKTVTVDANPTLVDYSSIGYVRNPVISPTVIDSGGSNVATVSDIETNNCNVRVFDTKTGSLVTGLSVNIIAEGI